MIVILLILKKKKIKINLRAACELLTNAWKRKDVHNFSSIVIRFQLCTKMVMQAKNDTENPALNK